MTGLNMIAFQDAAFFGVWASFQDGLQRNDALNEETGKALKDLYAELNRLMPLPPHLKDRANDDECVAFGRARDEKLYELYKANPAYQAPFDEQSKLWVETITPLAQEILSAEPITSEGIALKNEFIESWGYLFQAGA